MQTDEVMGYKGLSAYLKMAQNTLRHKVMRGEIPFFKIGKCVRFSKKILTCGLKNTAKNLTGILRVKINALIYFPALEA
jgi:hypothetical protein